jgi:catechol 2,3-dioxygenase-like lactoylglutathione lyase family enzyme
MDTKLGAVGVGVSDLERSVHFYTKVLDIGLVAVQTFDAVEYKEVVLVLLKGQKVVGPAVLLMQYKNGQKPVKQQGKFVFYVDKVKPALDRAKAYGSEIHLDLGTGEGVIKEIAMVRDPDGYIVEFFPYSAIDALNKTASPPPKL